MVQIDEENSKPEKLDKKDLKIIEILKENSRLSFQQIAKRANMSHDSIAYRIKRFEKQGIIDKYSIKLNYPLLGFSEYHVLFQHVENKPDKVNAFCDYLIKNNNIASIIYYSDKWDLKVRIVVKDNIELDRVLTDINSKFGDIILDKQILAKIRDCVEDKEEDFENRHERPVLNEKDTEIINLLSNDSRMSLVEISKKTGLNADTIMYKLKRYKEKKIIQKFRTDTNVNKMGLHWYNLLLLMKFFGKEEEKKLRDFFSNNQSLTSIIKTIGEWNIILTILAKDPKEFHNISTTIRRLLGDSLKDYDSLLAYKELKNKNIKL